ncbi:MAG: serine/threonine-protein kinase, partial [Pseudomonadota bacterium]
EISRDHQLWVELLLQNSIKNTCVPDYGPHTPCTIRIVSGFGTPALTVGGERHQFVKQKPRIRPQSAINPPKSLAKNLSDRERNLIKRECAMTSIDPSAQTEDSVFDELEPGTTLMHGQFTIKDYLNSGGFGITYLATDSLDRTVVIKECFPSTLCRRSRMMVQARSKSFQEELRWIIRLFTREARALAKLKHPYIVGVHQVFEDNNTAYMALDFVRGNDLLTLIEGKANPLTTDEVRTLLKKTLKAIGFVHDAGMLHRDISPDNIILNESNDPVLIDFGAAREQATKETRALSALRVVKEGYSPQEFYVAGSDQGPSSDLYSLAASFYQVITGDIPPDSQIRLAAHVAGKPDPYIPLAQKTDAYDAHFCNALDRAMAVLPVERVQSAEEWLQLIAEEGRPITGNTYPTTAPAPTTGEPQPLAPPAPSTIGGMPKRTSRARNAGLVLACSVVGLVAAGGAAVTVLTNTQVGPGEFFARSSPEVSANPAPADEQSHSFIETRGTEEGSHRPIALPRIAAPRAPIEMVRELDTAGGTTQTIASGWSVSLPFKTVSPESLIISETEDGAPASLTPGWRLVAINGEAVTSYRDALVRARAGQPAPGAHSVEVGLVLADPEGGQLTELTLPLPIVHETKLANGLIFTSRRVDGTWTTVVADVPGHSTGLRSGDVLVALLPTKEPIADGTSFNELLTREIDAGRSELQVAIRRNGSMWIETMPVTNPAG